MKRLVKEPLLHFLLLGAAIFILFEVVSPQDPETAADAHQTIVVSEAQIEALAERFARTWQRPPGEQELEGLIQDFIREEVAVREAAALGIDRDDSVIRRLLRQRLEFVTGDLAVPVTPADGVLEAYLRAHPAHFRTETRISFSHIFFDPARRKAGPANEALALRARLNAGGGEIDVSELGDATLLERQFVALPLSDTAQLFGDRFAAGLAGSKAGQWSGPIASPYGEHLVYVSAVTPGRVPPLGDVRDAVQREWLNAKRLEALDAFYSQLLQRYRVTIEKPQRSGADRVAGLR